MAVLYEEAFTKMKRAAGVSSTEEVVKRLNFIIFIFSKFQRKFRITLRFEYMTTFIKETVNVVSIDPTFIEGHVHCTIQNGSLSYQV